MRSARPTSTGSRTGRSPNRSIADSCVDPNQFKAAADGLGRSVSASPDGLDCSYCHMYFLTPGPRVGAGPRGRAQSPTRATMHAGRDNCVCCLENLFAGPWAGRYYSQRLLARLAESSIIAPYCLLTIFRVGSGNQPREHGSGGRSIATPGRPTQLTSHP